VIARILLSKFPDDSVIVKAPLLIVAPVPVTTVPVIAVGVGELVELAVFSLTVYVITADASTSPCRIRKVISS